MSIRTTVEIINTLTEGVGILGKQLASIRAECDRLREERGRLRAALAFIRDALQGDIVEYDDVTTMLQTADDALNTDTGGGQ